MLMGKGEEGRSGNGKLIPRYSKQEFERLVKLMCPVERYSEFNYGPWKGEGFRHHPPPEDHMHRTLLASKQTYRP